MIASCGMDVKLHEWPDGKLIFGVPPPKRNTSNFKSISWSTSGKQLLVVPSADRPILLKASEEKTKQGGCFTTEVFGGVSQADVAVFSRNSERIAAFGSASGEVFILDLCTKEVIKSYVTLPSPVTLLNYTYNDSLLSAGCKNGQIFLYNSTGNVSASFYVPWSYSVSSILFHPARDNILAASSREGVVAIWDVHTNAAKFVVKSHSGCVTGMAISPSEEILATVSSDRRVNIYDLRTKESILNKEFSSELTAITCSPMLDDFAIGTSKGRILSLDKRQPHYTKGSFSAQKGSIRSIQFDTSNTSDAVSYSIAFDMTHAILLDEDSSTAPLSNIESDTKTQASGDFTAPEDISGISRRIPGGMDDVNKETTEQWIERIPIAAYNCAEKKVPIYQVIDETSLADFKEELIQTSKKTMLKFMEDMTTQFLKIRMGVSREFCLMETGNNKRWQDLSVALLKLAGFEDTKRDADVASEVAASEESEMLGSRQQDSIYSPAKTKMTNYSQQKSATIAKPLT